MCVKSVKRDLDIWDKPLGMGPTFTHLLSMCVRSVKITCVKRDLDSTTKWILLDFRQNSLTKPLQHTAMHCNALQCTAMHCNTLQHTATHGNTLQHTATHCNTLLHTATHYNTLQHTATHCNTLQHTATHCNYLISDKTFLLPVSHMCLCVCQIDTRKKKSYVSMCVSSRYKEKKSHTCH